MRACLASAAVLAVLGTGTGCTETLEPGSYGRLRYLGNVRGATPLTLLPPLTDREGNAYVLFGDLALPNETQLFIGQIDGGWSSEGCDITFGTDFGVHGFVGRAQDRAWYWSGGALVRASAPTGKCTRILELDPSSAARLSFVAVVPDVRDTPSRTTTLAWIQAPTDPRPFEVVVDLNSDNYTSITELRPLSATEVEVLGVGANPETHEGVVVARYREGEAIRVRAFFYDHLGDRVDEVSISGLDTLPAYGIRGYLMASELGLYAGLDVEGQVLVLDKSGGRRVGVSGMVPAGVHRWGGQLYLVGEEGGRPRVAAIDDDGDISSPSTWDTSLDAGNLGGSVEVVDDRSLPSRTVDWSNPRTAMGPFPFVHAHSPDPYADDTTTWLIAGPSFSTAGEDRTAIAFGPVGITYEE
jgi:hypothetical protein